MNAHHVVPRGEADFDLYPYTPSAIAGYIFLVLFGIAAATHVVWAIWMRTWYFIPFILGCIGEAGGYYGRAWSHQDIRNGSPYLLQMMLILGSAPLLAASIYMTLGRFIRALNAEEHAIFRPRFITFVYVVIDIGSFVCQIMGSASQISGPEGARQGRLIVMGGLAVQLVALVGFIAMSATLHVRLNRRPTMASESPHVYWRRHMRILYAVCVLVLVRNLFRLIEFAEGADGVIARTEALLYIFDPSLLFAAAVCWAVAHPGMLLRSIRKAESKPTSEDGPFIPLREQSR
ncbi:putative RTA1 domain protein [Lophiostoma macrostomum CBS 122681]|uniref:Putative RTA1 domain protein n=1 Tax=Lophiostoma macrostomum CBS 122681 TaxID=1314788 RepID=A0A6A6SSW4_9PLEO|nr:putative RTA1 domain protein [Lophiostoma macrostomum CBS 122681]